MGESVWTAVDAGTVCFVVTIAVSLLTRARHERELVGLVYSLTERPRDAQLPWHRRPVVLGVIVLAATALLNVVFF